MIVSSVPSHTRGWVVVNDKGDSDFWLLYEEIDISQSVLALLCFNSVNKLPFWSVTMPAFCSTATTPPWPSTPAPAGTALSSLWGSCWCSAAWPAWPWWWWTWWWCGWCTMLTPVGTDRPDLGAGHHYACSQEASPAWRALVEAAWWQHGRVLCGIVYGHRNKYWI